MDVEHSCFSIKVTLTRIMASFNKCTITSCSLLSRRLLGLFLALVIFFILYDHCLSTCYVISALWLLALFLILEMFFIILLLLSICQFLRMSALNSKDDEKKSHGSIIDLSNRVPKC